VIRAWNALNRTEKRYTNLNRVARDSLREVFQQEPNRGCKHRMTDCGFTLAQALVGTQRIHRGQAIGD
jgi:hypothetical protein